ncbi:MAG: hypothetical protein KKI08_08485 [Armatimonadetes bacterium]|nr:hypothetical protein [Armatimonadota bacterium]
MAAHIHLPIATPPPYAPRPNIIHSYTCPRCRQMNSRFPCEHCAWTPDVIVGALEHDEEREDAIVAC